MKLVLFGVALLFNLLPVCYARVQYESIFWDPDLFSHEVNRTLYVALNSEINIICPNPDIVVKKRFKERQPHTTYENLWLAYNKTSYDNCRVDKKYDPNAILYPCNNPESLAIVSLPFGKYVSIAEGEDCYLI